MTHLKGIVKFLTSFVQLQDPILLQCRLLNFMWKQPWQ